MATLITKNSSTASAVPAAGDLVKGELAVNVTDKKVYTKDNSAAVVKLVGSLGNQEANAVAITGGTINGTTIGATTPSTGAFTTASASSGFTGNLTGNVTGNVSGTAANVTGVVAIANGGTGLSALGTGVQSALGQAVTGSGSFVLSTSPSLTTPNLGTPSAAVLTNATGLPLTTGVTGTLGVANGGTGITAFGTGVATALGQNVTGSGGIVLATSPSLTTPNLGTPSAATLTNATGLPISTGVSGLGTGVATALAVNVGTAGAFVVNGGALGTPSGGTLTNCTGYPTSALSGSINLATQVTGTLATTNGGTGLTSFTANGVVYASSSSALTTGSALTFDGTNLGVGTSSPSAPVDIQANSGGTGIRIRGRASANAGAIRYFANDNTTQRARVESNDTGLEINSIANLPVYFLVNDTEQMRLTSTGLGIGTSSPLGRLTIQGAAGTSGINQGIGLLYSNGTQYGALGLNNSSGWPQLMARAGAGMTFHVNSDLVTTGEAMRLDSSGNLLIGYTSNNLQSGTFGQTIYGSIPGLTFAGTEANARTYTLYETGGSFKLFDRNAGADRWTVDSSGNLGLGVTPSAGTSGKVFQITNAGHFMASGPTVYIDANAYFDSGWKYITTAAASNYYQNSGAHIWQTAPSDTAGNAISFTQAMTLDASGNLFVGYTGYPTGFSTGKVVLRQSSVNAYGVVSFASSGSTQCIYIGHDGTNGYIGTTYGSGSSYTPLVFQTSDTERARITSGGDLLVGTTSGSFRFVAVSSASDYISRLQNTASSTPQGLSIYYSGASPNGTGSPFLFCEDQTVLRMSVRSNGGIANYQSNNVDLSDARTKKEITPAPSYWDKIGALEIVTYKYNDQTHDDVNVGVIAQQVESVEPVWVDSDGFGETPEDGIPLKTVYTKDITFAAIKTLQEAMERIEQLEAKVAALEAK